MTSSFRITLDVLLFSFITIGTTSAQYVTLADTGVKYYLTQAYPSCLNTGGQLDTNCALTVTTITDLLDGPVYYITDLTDLKYFKNLDTLICQGYSVISGPVLDSLPPLPSSLKYLNCSGNSLKKLPPLPSTLTYLDCSENSFLDTLPILPNSLTYLNCNSDTSLSGLPTLPPSLTYLDCSYDYMKCLPLLPVKLRTLILTGGRVFCIPNKPYGLEVIYLVGFPQTNVELDDCTETNQIPGYNCPIDTNFVDIPDSSWENYLQTNFPGCVNGGGQLDTTCSVILNITSLKLDSLDISNLTGIQYFKNLDTLDCSGNNLDSLPPLPPSLMYLNCSNNKLKNLPQLIDSLPNARTTVTTSSLVNLNCENNQLTCLPVLPNGLQSLQAKGNHIACLPNLPSSLVNLDSAYQVCNNTNNINGCTVQEVTGIANTSNIQTQVNVFPNPSSGLVTINCPYTAVGIKVSGMDGKIIYEIGSTGNTYTIDLSSVTKGIYMAQIISLNGVVTQKLIIQ